MPVNLTNLQKLIQKAINAADATTSVYDLELLVKAAKKVDSNLIVEYDNAAALPDATTSLVKIAFNKSLNKVVFNTGTWRAAGT